MHYKITGGRLYWNSNSTNIYRDCFNEVLLFTLYLYPTLPDMEFSWSEADLCEYDSPTMKYTLCRDRGRRGGFPVVGYAPTWLLSMGPLQMATFHACLDARYPLHNRIPKLVWRGSSTNTFRINDSNYHKVTNKVTVVLILVLTGLSRADGAKLKWCLGLLWV